MSNIVQHHRGTTEEWAISTYIPADGELIIEECSDGSRRCKIGNGQDLFARLTYVDATAIESLLDLSSQISDISSAISTLEQDVARDLAALEGSVKGLIQPDINNLDVKYSACLTAMENKHTEDIEDLKKDILSLYRQLIFPTQPPVRVFYMPDGLYS